MPSLIRLLGKLVPYPAHLKELLAILINISTKDGIGKDFIYDKYNFVEIMQDIFKEYPFSEDTSEIHENAYQLLANLASDDAKPRDEFINAKFLEHIAYLLGSSEISLRRRTINKLAFAIVSF